MSNTKIEWFRMRDQEHPQNSLYEGIPDFDGLKASRPVSCAPWAVCNGLCVALASVFYLYFYFLSDPNRLHCPADFRADLCGLFQLQDKPFVFFPDPAGMGMTGTCLASCPVSTSPLCFYFNDGQRPLEDYCYQTYPTRAVNRYCVPSDQNSPAHPLVLQQLTSLRQMFQMMLGTFHLQLVQVAGLALAMSVLGLLFNAVLVLCLPVGKVLFYLLSTQAVLSLSFLGYQLYREQAALQLLYCQSPASPCLSSTLLLYKIAMYLCALSAVYLALSCLMAYKRIKVFFQLSFLLQALRKQKALLLFSFLSQVASTSLLLLFAYMTVQVSSNGQVSTVSIASLFPSPIYRAILYSPSVWAIYAGVLLALLLALDYLSSLHRMVVSGAVSVFFFNFVKIHLNAPISRSLLLSLFKQSGQMVRGTFLLLLSTVPRKVCQLAQFLLYKYYDKHPKRGRGFFCLMSCLMPLVTLWEKSLKYLHIDNFIHMAVYGESFSLSGQKIFYLKTRNLSRLSRIYPSLDYLTLSLRASLASLCALLLWANSQLSLLTLPNPFFPTPPPSPDQFPAMSAFFSLLLFFAASSIQSGMIDQGIRTAMLLFCADEEMYYGRQRRSVVFRAEMDKWGVESEKIKAGRLKVNDQVELQVHQDLFTQVQANIQGQEDKAPGDNFDDFFEKDDDEEYYRQAKQDRYTVEVVENTNQIEVKNDQAAEVMEQIENKEEGHIRVTPVVPARGQAQTYTAAEVNNHLLQQASQQSFHSRRSRQPEAFPANVSQKSFMVSNTNVMQHYTSEAEPNQPHRGEPEPELDSDDNFLEL